MSNVLINAMVSGCKNVHAGTTELKIDQPQKRSTRKFSGGRTSLCHKILLLDAVT